MLKTKDEFLRVTTSFADWTATLDVSGKARIRFFLTVENRTLLTLFQHAAHRGVKMKFLHRLAPPDDSLKEKVSTLWFCSLHLDYSIVVNYIINSTSSQQ